MTQIAKGIAQHITYIERLPSHLERTSRMPVTGRLQQLCWLGWLAVVLMLPGVPQCQ